MKPIVPGLMLLFLHHLLLAQNAGGFGDLSFNEPANYTATDKGTYRAYSFENKANNAFCIISVYNSEASSGSLDQDFRTAWKGIVAGHFTVIKSLHPQQNSTPGGLSYLQDEANVSSSQGMFFARLLVLDLKGKTQAILFLSGNKNTLAQFQSDQDSFLASLKQNNTSADASLTATDNTQTPSGSNTTTAASTVSGGTHFNHMSFVVPDGWKASQQGSFFEMHPTDLASDEFLSYFFLQPVNDTSFANVALQTISDMATALGGESFKEDVYGNSPLYEINNSGRFVKGWEYSTGRSHIRIKHSNNSGIIDFWFYYLGIFMVKVHGRIERVVFLSKDLRRGLDQNSTYLKPAYENIIRDFFYSLEFDDWTDPKYTVGKVTHTGISHVWGGVSYFEGATGSTFNVGSMQATYLIFFNNGQVFLNSQLPLHGLNDVDTYIQAATYPRWWGTYTYKDGAGVIKLSYETIPFKLEKGQINLNHYQTSIPYAQISSLDGSKLNGNWCMKGSYGGKAICLNLGPDGRFSDNGVIHYLEHNINTCFTGAPANGEGTYEIKNNSILFRYNDGTINQAAFSGLKLQSSDLSPGELHLGYHDDAFQKQ